MAIVPVGPLEQEEFQSDFSGGENSVSDPLLLASNELSRIQNLYQRRGGGLTVRKGFKDVATVTGQGRFLTEVDQAFPTVLTKVNVGPNWYEEQMQPNFRFFNQTPGTGDELNIGAREKFNQLITNMLFAYVVGGNTFAWRVSNGAGGWIDKTAQIVESVANAKQMMGAVGEWVFSWPDFSDWLPQQVETRGFQYWLSIICTLGGTNGGADVFHGQRRIRGSFLGRRLILAATVSNFHEIMGFTLTPASIEVWPTGQRIDRIRGVAFNDYFYYGSAGQRPLKRWNMARGVTRLAGNNNPVDAGLLPPPAFTAGNLGQALNANAYAAGVVLRYLVTYEYGPEGILGESPPCVAGAGFPPPNEITTAAVNQVTVNLANAIATAATREVSAINLYVTDDIVNTKIPERVHPNSSYYLIAHIVRDDATWAAGTFVDTFVPRTKSVPSPPPYATSPPFYPKYVASGGGRLWIADDYNVAWSDIGRADSWDPFNQAKFRNVRGILWRKDRMLVFHDNDISFIAGVNSTVPAIDFFYLGLGNVQADSITVAENKVMFVSRLGPAVILEDDSVALTGSGRVFESANYWASKAGERDFANGAFFNRRWWIPVDKGGPTASVGRTACLDLQGPGGDRGAWSLMIHKEGSSQEQVWGALAVIHAPLDHALARELILVGFPDANGSAQTNHIRLLEYGTTDNWSSVPTDGQKINFQVESRALAMRFLNRWKSYKQGHLRYTLPLSGAATMSLYLVKDRSPSSSKVFTITTGSATPRDQKVLWREATTPGVFRDVAPLLHVDSDTDSGFDLMSLWANADVEDFSTL